MTSSPALTSVLAGYEQGLSRYIEVAREVLEAEHALSATDAHVSDVVAAAIDADPASLAAVVRAGETTDGVRGIVRAALSELKSKRPRLFQPLPCQEAQARTRLAARLGSNGWDQSLWLSALNDVSLTGADGVEGNRRIWVEAAEALDAAGKAHLVDCTPPPSSGRGLFSDINDPREAALRMGVAPDASQPQVGASRVPTLERGQIAGDPRPIKKHLVPLFDPAGELHHVEIERAGDLVRQKMWRRPVGGATAIVVNVQAENVDDPAPVVAAAPVLVPLVPSKLTELRREVRALGVEPAPSWGVRRLSDEIAAKQGSATDDATQPPTPGAA